MQIYIDMQSKNYSVDLLPEIFPPWFDRKPLVCVQE